MSYIALYRKYRPRDFDEIVGQDAIVTTLKNQIKSEKVGHAYLFCGMRGTGKTSTARVFAKALNCEKGPTVNPCNECASCRAINGGSMVDVIEMDAASNRGIDDIRDLREKVNFPPSEGRYKVYIIDEVHMLTTEAFNALLKTLEEPPRHVVFILATTEPNKLPPTILSRCMRFDFRRVSTRELVKRMKEVAADVGVEAEDMALAQLARSSQGSVRDALSLLDRAVAFGGNKLLYGDVLDLLGAVSREVLYEVSGAVLQKDGGRMLGIVDDMATRGKDLFRFVDDLMEHYRNILLVAIGADRQLIDVVDEEYPELQKLAGNYSQEKILSIIDILKDASNDMKWSSQPRIVLESAMVKLTLPELWENSQGYISRIQDLEQQMASLREQVQRVMEAAAHASSGTNGADTDKAANEANTDVAAGEARLQKSDSADAPSAAATRDTDEERLQQLIQSWPEIIEELGGIRKTLQTFIKEGHVRPCRIEKDNVFLFCPQEYKEIILLGKQIIEDVVRKITGMEIYVKGLESQPVDDEKKNF
ncbi:MAG TPA: DNA polymerase III subunit gamma/tau [Thermoanaerobacterales bacterium]|nr:DNA polymerase III subunit gamma/tau [Thermoanaerobacterales bacterium]